MSRKRRRCCEGCANHKSLQGLWSTNSHGNDQKAAVHLGDECRLCFLFLYFDSFLFILFPLVKVDFCDRMVPMLALSPYHSRTYLSMLDLSLTSIDGRMRTLECFLKKIALRFFQVSRSQHLSLLIRFIFIIEYSIILHLSSRSTRGVVVIIISMPFS